MSSELRECAHEACDCKISIEQKFCSTSCEQAAAASQTHSTECRCGHAACSHQRKEI